MLFDKKSASLNAKKPAYEIFSWREFSIGFFSAKSEMGGQNEDFLFFRRWQDSSVLLGVADGAGGHPRGADAAQTCAEGMTALKNPESSVSKQYDICNQNVLSLKAGARSTLACMKIVEDKAEFYSVGDSEIVYWNSRGSKVYSSIPYSPAGLKVEAGVSEQKDSLTDPERHEVMSLMGDPFVHIHSTTPLELKKGHLILLGSDGLFDNIAHEKIYQILSNSPFEEGFKTLVDRCIKRDQSQWLKDDDISFWVLKMSRPFESTKIEI